MHIAYNMINPHNFNRHAPFYDHQKLHKACRELEKKYGFKMDKGIDENTPKKKSKTNIKAQAFEAHHGQESFNSFAKNKKDDILSIVKTAKNWQEIHESFLKIGLEITPKGNGLVFKDRHGKHSIKASDVDRSLGKKQMEQSFGSFIGVNKKILTGIKSDEKYDALPLHQDAWRGDLYALFLAEMEQRKTALASVKKQEEEAFKANRERWAEKRKNILGRYALLPVDQRRLMQEIKIREEAELTDNRLALAEKCNAIREAMPYTSWTKFLQHKAALGNETALEILQSKKLKPELSTTNSKDKLNEKLEAIKQSKELQAKIIRTQGVNQNHRRALLAVAKMREVVAKNPALKDDELKYTIDTKGTVIFTLKTGGTIRDSGTEIHFSSYDESASKLAQKFASARWGLRSTYENNLFKSTAKTQKQKNNGPSL
jgi:Relaxase/Mobilisation nuclease domain.